MITFETINIRIHALYTKSDSGLHVVIKNILDLVDINSFEIYNLVNLLNNIFNKKYNKNYSLIELGDIFNVIYSSNRALFNLPPLLNNKFVNHKPCSYTIFGEDLTLLSCMAMNVDATNELIQFILNYYPEKKNIIPQITSIDFNYDINIFTKNKDEIQNNFKKFYNLLIKISHKLKDVVALHYFWNKCRATSQPITMVALLSIVEHKASLLSAMLFYSLNLNHDEDLF
jgi:hypothetical protein